MPENFFSDEQKAQIKWAIQEAEKQTSGEIRLHLEKRCDEDVLDHAAFIFEKLEMHKTKLRNGVLLYVSFEDHKLAILGDAGINAKVPKGFWDEIKNHLVNSFREGNYTGGLCDGIIMAGEQLKAHFPWQANDVNELSNDISYGKE
jgi:uncharacterized membrane protein